jgi:hypothetical protein
MRVEMLTRRGAFGSNPRDERHIVDQEAVVVSALSSVGGDEIDGERCAPERREVEFGLRSQPLVVLRFE